MAATLILMIFFLTSSTRTARWTTLGNWLLVAPLVWQGAPYTGTSLNPARSLAAGAARPRTAASLGVRRRTLGRRRPGRPRLRNVPIDNHADGQALS